MSCKGICGIKGVALFTVGSFFLLSCGEDNPPATIPLSDWEIREVEVTYSVPLNKFHFLDESKGFVLDLILLKTEDGGRTFKELTPYINAHSRRELAVYDENHLWYAVDSLESSGGRFWTHVYRSSDGGTNWEKFTRENLIIYKISFASPDLGFAYGLIPGIDSITKLFQTRDGGETWSPMESINVSLFGIERFHWKDRNLGFLVSLSGAKYRTLDGGISWETFVSNERNESSEFYPFSSSLFYDIGINQTVRVDLQSSDRMETDPAGIYVLNQVGENALGVQLEAGCLPAEPCENRLVSSKDGGRTWVQHEKVNYWYFYNRAQEIRPGLTVFPQVDPSGVEPGKFIFVKNR